MNTASRARLNIGLAGSVLRAARTRASSSRWKRYAAVALVLVIHFGVFWIATTAMRFGVPGAGKAGNSSELEVHLISPNLVSRGIPAPPTDWDFLAPTDVPIAEPEIDIIPEQQASGDVGVTSTRLKLPPRFDPTHVNDKPELPRSVAMIGALSVELEILVLPDGTVGDAKVVKSTGQPDIDRIAIETVEGSWRYIPATVGGKPVEAWTTIIVRFAAI